MTIQSVKWMDSTNTTMNVVDDDVTMFVPSDPNNAEYKLVQDWINAGNTIADADPPPIVVPVSISRVQFFKQLAAQNTITWDEASAVFTQNKIPQSLANLVAELPSDQQAVATIDILGSTNFLRTDSLSVTIGQLEGWSSAQIDEFFISASKL